MQLGYIVQFFIFYLKLGGGGDNMDVKIIEKEL